jgi:hypothetical protein
MILSGRQSCAALVTRLALHLSGCFARCISDRRVDMATSQPSGSTREIPAEYALLLFVVVAAVGIFLAIPWRG